MPPPLVNILLILSMSPIMVFGLSGSSSFTSTQIPISDWENLDTINTSATSMIRWIWSLSCWTHVIHACILHAQCRSHWGPPMLLKEYHWGPPILLKEIRIESIGQEIGDKAKIKLHMILLPLSLTPDAAKPARRSPQAASAMLSPSTLSPQNAGGIRYQLQFLSKSCFEL